MIEKCVDNFLVDRSKKVGLGQEANKTNGSPSNAKGIKRKLFHGRPPNSNLAKGSKKNKKGASDFTCFQLVTWCVVHFIAWRNGVLKYFNTVRGEEDR